MTQEGTAVRYEYSTFDSKKVEDIEKVCNQKAGDGWELVEAWQRRTATFPFSAAPRSESILALR